MENGDKSVHGKSGAFGPYAWAAVIAMGGIFGAAVWFSFRAWQTVPNLMTTNGFIAMTLGIVFTIALGAGLMGLVFWSHKKGYDR